ncbi:hypothetical protein DFQ01_13092 [Paenibacillus cellulosilyticus]|uniref:N-acetylglutamate synthase n=1 Tax=Paenibacillus cellulosilyticus TaxID=375489 RepID=A0A2V2YP90_9BACL|nr:n-acetylglutamate synthase [Paenibacillus cellulosilyticus]PWV94527.1 hypothetical protein DFQ01_13092 [Paenibacillus cellulosilyticus]QKS45031.1 n-acetylglutamate synthase [Paenibacillus cellulosilyticus]
MQELNRTSQLGIDYNERRFRTVSNTANGEVNDDTVFPYFQQGRTVWAEYSGGGILKGHLIAIVDDTGALDMRYHHHNEQGELMTGICKSTPELLSNGKLRMHEQWEWTCKDRSRGHSIIEEI